MHKAFDDLLNSTKSLNSLHKPLFFALSSVEDKNKLNQLFAEKKILFVHDEYKNQLAELLKSQQPTEVKKYSEWIELAEKEVAKNNTDELGIWVFYPWSGRLVHILNKEEFIEMRTTRNQYKITKQERETLVSKKIGIIGLSVGQSVAITLAMERVCGELRLADFDFLELSNLNRIRSGIHNLGVMKVVMVAREISEIDPFLKVTIYNDGLTENNIEKFYTENGKIDILIDECDGLDMKIISRIHARNMHIPVVMDTSDRGMIDIERFDLDPNREILHGLGKGINPEKLKGLSNEEKVPYILQLLEADKISSRLRASMMEVEQTITTWPQLASSVVLGGAKVTDVCRRIFLNQLHVSGRFYLDIEELISGESLAKNISEDEEKITIGSKEINENELTFDHIKILSKKIRPSENILYILDNETVKTLVNSAVWAPSTGNNQPWKWYYRKGELLLFIDRVRSNSFGDYNDMGTLMSFGAALENLTLTAASMNIGVNTNIYNEANDTTFIASVTFTNNVDENLKSVAKKYVPNMFKRITNRSVEKRYTFEKSLLDEIKYAAQEIENINVKIIDDEKLIEQLADLLSKGDRMRFKQKQAHLEFYKELRWTDEEARQTGDGVDLETIDLTPAEVAGLKISRNWKVMQHLIEWQAGKGYERMTRKQMSGASAIGIIYMNGYSRKNFLTGGSAVERAWIKANELGLAFQPMMSLPFFFARLVHGKGEGFPEFMKKTFEEIREPYKKIIGVDDNDAEIFMFRVFKGTKPVKHSYRLPLERVLFFE